MADLYTKAVLTVIAAGVAALIYQNAKQLEAAERSVGCGDGQYNPCFIVFANDDPIRVEAADRDGLRVQAFADDFSVSVSKWNEPSDLDVRVTNWP